MPKTRLPGPEGTGSGAGRKAAAGPSPRPPGDRAPALRGITGPWLNKRHSLQGTMVVGRLPDVPIQIDDDSVSRRHAEIEVSPRGVVVRDLGSANGTTVNGERIREDVVLSAGDVLGFGVVEFEFEPASPSDAPLRRPTRSSTRQLAQSADGGRARPLLAVLLLLAVGVSGAVAYKRLLKPRRSSPAAVAGAAVQDTQADREKALIRCRSAADTSAGRTPDWDEALRACNRYLDLNPIDPVANELVERIKSERQSAALFERALVAARQNREEESLELLEQLPESSLYFRRAQTTIEQTVKPVLKRTEQDCQSYVKARLWERALVRCEKYARLLCQNLPEDEREQPEGTRLALGSNKLREGQWRPKDRTYQLFLLARTQTDPGAAPWKCPEVKLLQKGTLAPEVEDKVAAIVNARVEAPLLRKALMHYWEGRADATKILTNVRNDAAQSALHGQVDVLRADMETVIQLFRLGQSKVQAKELKSAFDSFQEALAADARLLREGIDSYPSFYRRSIQTDFARAAYDVGMSYFNERGNIPEACVIFKMGRRMYPGDIDLNRAIQRCTDLAAKAFKNADTCEALENGLKEAVEGDGFAEKIQGRMKEMGCTLALDTSEGPG